MIIDINKVILFFLLSIYSGYLSMLAGHKFLVVSLSIIVIMCFFIYSFIAKNFKNNKTALDILIGLTVLVVCAKLIAPPHIKDIISYIVFASGYVFLIMTLYYLVTYMQAAKKLFIDNKEYIYHDKFKCAFGPAIISVIVYGLFFYPLCIFEKHIGFINTILLFGIFAALASIVAGYKLIPYIYAFKLLSLKGDMQIYVKDIYNDYDNNKFFNRFIEPYINHVYLDDDKICFYTQEKREAEQKENINNILHSCVERIDKIINNAFENKAGIYNNLCSIKATILKINDIGSSHKLESYLYDIENKYLPYIENISKTYIENMHLPADLTMEIQSKIENSLAEVNNALQEILKSMFTMKKIDVESSIDVMNIKLMQNGLLNSIKKES